MKKIFLFLAIVLLGISAIAIGFYGHTATKVSIVNGDSSIKKDSGLAAKELIQVVKRLKNAQTIDAEFTVVLSSEEKHEDFGQFEGRYIKDGNNYYIKSYESENLINDKYLIAIDHEEKSIFVESGQEQSSKNESGIAFLYDLDSLVNLSGEAVKIKMLDNNQAVLTLELGFNQYSHMQLIYDFNSKELKRLYLYPFSEIFNQEDEGEIGINGSSNLLGESENVPDRVEIIYHRISIDKKIDKKWFNENKYFKVGGTNITPSLKFSDYEIDFQN